MDVDIDEGIYNRLDRRAKAKGFESAEAYSAFVLETVIDELDSDEDDEVRDRLEDLGYLG